MEFLIILLNIIIPEMGKIRCQFIQLEFDPTSGFILETEFDGSYILVSAPSCSLKHYLQYSRLENHLSVHKQISKIWYIQRKNNIHFPDFLLNFKLLNCGYVSPYSLSKCLGNRERSRVRRAAGGRGRGGQSELGSNFSCVRVSVWPLRCLSLSWCLPAGCPRNVAWKCPCDTEGQSSSGLLPAAPPSDSGGWGERNEGGGKNNKKDKPALPSWHAAWTSFAFIMC